MSNKLQQWRKGLVEDGTLPSGLEIKFKKNAGVFDMAKEGKIPSVLLGMMKGDTQTTPTVDMFEKMPEMLQVAEVLIKTTWVEPKIADKPSDDAITIDEIPANDKFVYMMYVLENSGGANSLGTFRTNKPANGNHAGLNGGAVRGEAVELSSD